VAKSGIGALDHAERGASGTVRFRWCRMRRGTGSPSCLAPTWAFHAVRRSMKR